MFNKLKWFLIYTLSTIIVAGLAGSAAWLLLELMNYTANSLVGD